MRKQSTGYGSIYALIDPREPEHVRYIGWTSRSLEARLRAHIADTGMGGSYKRNWLASLKRDGVTPEIVLVEEVPSSEWAARERYWIAAMKNAGDRLTNTTAGGDGNFGVPKELFLQWAAKRRGRKHTPESILKMRMAKLGKKRSAEANAKASATSKGKCYSQMTPEIRAKISASLMGRKRAKPYTEEQLAKYRAAAQRLAAERKASGKTILVSVETRKKLSEASKRTWADLEVRKKHSAAVKRSWQCLQRKRQDKTSEQCLGKTQFGDAPTASKLI